MKWIIHHDLIIFYLFQVSHLIKTQIILYTVDSDIVSVSLLSHTHAPTHAYTLCSVDSTILLLLFPALFVHLYRLSSFPSFSFLLDILSTYIYISSRIDEGKVHIHQFFFLSSSNKIDFLFIRLHFLRGNECIYTELLLLFLFFSVI